MKKIKLSVLMLICMFGVVACALQEPGNEAETTNVNQESAAEELNEISAEVTAGSNEEVEATDNSNEDVKVTDMHNEDLETTEDNDEGIVTTEPIYADLQDEHKMLTIELASVKEFHAQGDEIEPFNLQIVSEEDNGVDWANEWYAQMNLSLPMIGNEWNRFYDEVYEYVWMGECLEIYEKETGKHLYTLEYPTDKWYVNGNNACIIDGVFYGASIANGYAQPDTCFMFAYDLNKEELLWRSADQSYNTMNFIVKEDVIICGYGFTAEKDYLYQINRYTGEIIDKTELKKMPDLLVEQDGKLYVHTYSYNYIIEFNE